MIINRVWAENVLKYATLDLNHLPTQGLTGISGANEGGKSTIGEIICFALFGRTFSYEEHEIVSVIRWGEPSCAVSVDFSINSHRYAVSRFLDEQGHHGARLSDHNDEPLARGVEPVREALEALLGFGFDEFIESFYLAQREITTPHPHSTAVKKMAGIAALEWVSAEAVVEICQERAAISDAERAIAEVERLIAKLNVDESLLPTLEIERDDLRVLQDQGSERVAALQATIERYQESAKNIQSAVEMFSGVKVDTTYQGWREHVERFGARLAELAQQHQGDATLTRMLGEFNDFVRGAKQRLSGVARLCDAARSYRKYLANLLGEGPRAQENDQQTIEPLDAAKARLKPQLHTAMSNRVKARVGLYVFLVLALVMWAVWGLITQAPESGMAQGVSAWLAGTVSGWEQTYEVWLPLAAGGLSVLFALCGCRRLYLGSKMARLRRALDDVDRQIAEARRQADTLDALDGLPMPQAVGVLAGFKDEDVSAEVLMFQQSASGDLIDAAKLDHYHARLHSLKDRFESDVIDQCRAFAAQIKTIQDDMTTRREKIDQLNEHIPQERARHRRLNKLKVSVASYQDHIAASNHRIQVRNLACDILQHGARHIAKTFNRDVRGLASRTLPLLTQGRYEDLKIDENLDVQVFSSEKRDFMQLEEISTGTQRQIMLAVRLALSQEFINTRLGRHQFIFLDEPFAFFDEERTRSALQVLPKLSNKLSQIWIVAQSFPEDFAFDLHIRCEPDKDVLTLTRG